MRIENAKTRNSAGNEKGMTLIELMVVIGIIAVLAGIATLGADFIRREQVGSMAKDILADLQKVRMNAMTLGSRGYGIRFQSSSVYTVFSFDDCDNNFQYDADTCAGSTREEKNAETRTIPAALTLKKSVPPGALNAPANNSVNDVLIYDRMGQPRQGNWDTVSEMIIVLQHTVNAGMVKCIRLTTNNIREGAWNGSSCTEH